MNHAAPRLRFGMTRLATGPRLHYAEQGHRAGEAIVFLHAYTDSWCSYSRVLPLLPSEHHAFGIDQRGHGESDKPECCYTAEDFAADVDAFMDAVGIGNATLVGDSSGGMIARQVALTYPRRVRRLVLIGSPTTLVDNDLALDFLKVVRTLEDPVPPEFYREFVESLIYHPLPEEFLLTLVSEGLKVPARVWRDYWEGVVLAIDHRERLGEIAAPTLVCWGDQDFLLSREDQEQMAAAIPHATLKVYPETGHLVHLERPERFVTDLMQFIRDTDMSPGGALVTSDGMAR